MIIEAWLLCLICCNFWSIGWLFGGMERDFKKGQKSYKSCKVKIQIQVKSCYEKPELIHPLVSCHDHVGPTDHFINYPILTILNQYHIACTILNQATIIYSSTLLVLF